MNRGKDFPQQVFLALLVSFGFVALPLPLRGQTSNEAIDKCLRDPDRDARIKYCSDVINGGQLSATTILGPTNGPRGMMLSRTGVSVLYLSRGLAYLSKKDYDSAISDFTDAVRLEPSNAMAFANRAMAHLKKSEYQKAIDDFGEVIRLDPYSSGAFLNRAAAYDTLGDHERAIKDYNQAIKIDPKIRSGIR